MLLHVAGAHSTGMKRRNQSPLSQCTDLGVGHKATRAAATPASPIR